MSGTLNVANLPWIVRLRTAVENAWDRIDQTLLRLQGRVDTPGYDRGLPYAFAFLLGALFITAELARHHSLLLGEETAKYAQATWQIAEGLRPETTLSGGHIVAEQGSLILYPLGLITTLLPGTNTLLVLKALALAITVIPLWRLARGHGRLSIAAASVVLFVFGLFTSVHEMNAADFAPAVLALPALMWAVLFGFDERKRLMVASIVFVLCCRADLGIAIAGLGLLLLLERRRRMGTIAIMLGLGWFLVSIYGLQPWLDDGTYSFLEPYAAFGNTPLRALWGIVSHPLQFLDTVTSEPNFIAVVSLLAPVLFLPLTAPRYLMPAVPLYVLYMGADVEAGRLREAAQTVPVTAFVFVAAVFALQRTGRTLVKRVRVERRILLALMLTALVFFVRDAPSSPYNKPWQWGDRDAADVSRIDAVETLPGIDVPVRASASILPLLSERVGVYALDTKSQSSVEQVAIEATQGVDWIILDQQDEETLEIGSFRGLLASSGWQRVARSDENGIEVYEFTSVIAPQSIAVAGVIEDAALEESADDEQDGELESGDG